MTKREKLARPLNRLRIWMVEKRMNAKIINRVSRAYLRVKGA